MPSTPEQIGSWQLWRRRNAAALCSALIVVAVVLTARRLAGAFTQPLQAVPAGAVATVAAGLSLLAFRWAADRVGWPSRRWAEWALILATVLPAPVIGGALSVAVTTPLCCYLAGLAGMLGLACGLRSAFAQPAAASCWSSDARCGSVSRDQPTEPRLAANQACHWQSRGTDADGRDRLEGTVQIDFAAGQRQAVAHVPFSPPFAQPPAVECEVLDDADVCVKPAAVYTYGLRLEARRGGDCTRPQSVPVGYEVCCLSGSST